MDIYVTGGIITTAVYVATNFIKKILNKRYVPLVPVFLTPLLGMLYAYLSHKMGIWEAANMGFISGNGAIVMHEFFDHTIMGKDNDKDVTDPNIVSK